MIVSISGRVALENTNRPGPVDSAIDRRSATSYCIIVVIRGRHHHAADLVSEYNPAEKRRVLRHWPRMGGLVRLR